LRHSPKKKGSRLLTDELAHYTNPMRWKGLCRWVCPYYALTMAYDYIWRKVFVNDQPDGKRGQV